MAPFPIAEPQQAAPSTTGVQEADKKEWAIPMYVSVSVVAVGFVCSVLVWKIRVIRWRKAKGKEPDIKMADKPWFFAKFLQKAGEEDQLAEQQLPGSERQPIISPPPNAYSSKYRGKVYERLNNSVPTALRPPTLTPPLPILKPLPQISLSSLDVSDRYDGYGLPPPDLLADQVPSPPPPVAVPKAVSTRKPAWLAPAVPLRTSSQGPLEPRDFSATNIAAACEAMATTEGMDAFRLYGDVSGERTRALFDFILIHHIPEIEEAAKRQLAHEVSEEERYSPPRPETDTEGGRHRRRRRHRRSFDGGDGKPRSRSQGAGERERERERHHTGPEKPRGRSKERTPPPERKSSSLGAFVKRVKEVVTKGFEKGLDGTFGDPKTGMVFSEAQGRRRR